MVSAILDGDVFGQKGETAGVCATDGLRKKN